MNPLPPCPGTPNCVCSDDTGASHIAPFRISGDPMAAWDQLIVALEATTGFTLVSNKGNDLIVKARTPIFGFVDDLIFQLRPERGEIAIRSASRIGYADFGTNRRRLESLRRALTAAGLLRHD